MARSLAALAPRKAPSQARSASTVNTICEAAIQVLQGADPAKFTTTRVAQRAGVSIGSIYQYFPNKQSLLSTVLHRHLISVVDAMEHTLQHLHGSDVPQIAAGLVTSFFEAKFRDREASAALYAVSAQVGGEAVIMQLTLRIQKAVTQALLSIGAVRIADAPVVSMVVCGSFVAPVQQILGSGIKRADAAKVQEQLIKMITAYLTSIAE
jgi:AcrR family transcriptional regulator